MIKFLQEQLKNSILFWATPDWIIFKWNEKVLKPFLIDFSSLIEYSCKIERVWIPIMREVQHSMKIWDSQQSASIYKAVRKINILEMLD